jgi:paraquat-inducible protein B
MPQARGLYLRVGALVVAGLALAVGFVLFFTASRLGSNSVTYETYVQESVQGLDVGSAVRYRGVAIGRVSEIGLVLAEYPRDRGEDFDSAFRLVFVRFTVDLNKVGQGPSVEEAVRLGLRVRVTAQGITGVNYLELDFVSPGRFPPQEVPWRPRYAYVPAMPSTVAQVQSAAETLLQRLQTVDLESLIANVVGFIADLRSQVHDGDLAIALQNAAELLRVLRGTGAEAGDLPATIAEYRAIATELREVLQSREIRQILANTSGATAELRGAAARLPASLAALEATLRSTRSAAGDLQAELAPILRDLRAAVSNLRDTTEALRRSPSQAIFGAPPPQESRR